MSNLNNREIYDRETYREVYRDGNGNLHTQQTTGTPIANGAPVTHGQRVNPAQNNPTAYRDGYVQGRVSEQHLQQEDQRVRDNDNAARGLLIGIILTSFASLVIGLLFLAFQRNETPTPASSPVAPSAAPANPSTTNRATTNRETTIIERNNTRIVPVPQQPAPAPNVTITVPDTNQQAPTQTAPDQSTPADPSQGTSGAVQNGANGTVTPVTPQDPAGTTTGSDATSGSSSGTPD